MTKVSGTKPAAGDNYRSMVNVSGSGFDITAMKADGNDMSIRVFNAEGDDAVHKITFDGSVSKAELVELDGRKKQGLDIQKDAAGKATVTVSMPRFGIRTIKLYNVSGTH